MFDIGVNLTNKQFSADIEQVIQQAKANHVQGLLITGTTVQESQKAYELAQQHKDYCWSTAGVHPHHANSWCEADYAKLKQLANKRTIVKAIGECGLDYYRHYSSIEQQKIAFQAQLNLAQKCQLPVFLHCRDAFSDFFALLQPVINELSGGVLHCFTGNKEELEEALSLGLYIGITGWICDEQRGKNLGELLPKIPINKLLVETDAPYLYPKDLLSSNQSIKYKKRNEPSYLPHIVKKIAALRGEDPKWLAEQTLANTNKFFSLK